MNYDVSSSLSLISHIHSLAADFLHERMRRAGLPELASSHGYILFCLSKSKTILIGDLAERINRDKSTTTVLVRKLQQEGFVSIEKDAADSRKRHVALTEKGRDYTDVTANISRELINTSYAGFTEQEKETLFTLLNRLSMNIHQ